MGMFLVEKGTAVFVIKEGDSWCADNIKPYITKNDNVFDKGEMILDPTGILSYAHGPGNNNIGQYYASNGYYGFKRDGWYIIVYSRSVQYA